MNYLFRFYIPDGDGDSTSWIDDEFPAESDDKARVLAIQKREEKVREYGEPNRTALYKQIAYP